MSDATTAPTATHARSDSVRSTQYASLARPQATLADLLDRVLDRGLVLHADVIITLAGVPLLGINLRAMLAGMETMLQAGLMAEWDQRIRGAARPPALSQGERAGGPRDLRWAADGSRGR